MAFAVVEISTDALELEGECKPNFPVVYEDLKYYCSKLRNLPAIVAEIRDGELVVTDAGTYLEIAKDLKRQTVRVLISSSPTQSQIEKVLEKWGGRLLDHNEIDSIESRESTDYSWHVFFFQRALTESEKEGFVTNVAEAFRRADGGNDFGSRISDVVFRDKQKSAEFQADTPAGDDRWFLEVSDEIRKFSESHVTIVSYQGMRL